MLNYDLYYIQYADTSTIFHLKLCKYSGRVFDNNAHTVNYNPIMDGNYAAFFDCMPVDWASDSMITST